MQVMRRLHAVYTHVTTCYMQVLVGLASASSGATSAGALRQSVLEKTVVGIFRDLRGIAMATNSRRTYGQCLLFQTGLHTFECRCKQQSLYSIIFWLSRQPATTGLSQMCQTDAVSSCMLVAPTL